MNKIEYNDYFLAICYLIAQRSIDPSTKCGAVLVSADKRVLSTGYNGPIKGVDDSKIPLTRPEKYPHIIHAEENCVLAYNGSKQDLEGATMYVTGAPCHKCLRIMLQKGIHNITITKGNKTVMHDDAEGKLCQQMLSYTPNVNYKVVPNIRQVVGLLENTIEYIIVKNPEDFC
jgi:dCMP deaminase